LFGSEEIRAEAVKKIDLKLMQEFVIEKINKLAFESIVCWKIKAVEAYELN